MEFLLIDPSRSVKAFIKLIRPDCNFIYASNMQEGLRLLETEAVGFVFFEWEQEGVPLLMSLQNPLLRRIALFSATNRLELKLLLTSGIDGFIKKPFTKERFSRCLSANQHHMAAFRTPEAAAPPTRPIRLLFCEDDSELQDIIHQEIKALGDFEATFAKDGLEGLQELERTSYDALITDIHMPGLNGQDLIERLRSSKQNRHLPVFIFSGATDHSMERFAANHLVSIFYKPYDIRHILEAINNKVFAARSIPAYHATLVDYWYETVNEILSANFKDFAFGTLEIAGEKIEAGYASSRIALHGSTLNGGIQLVCDRGFCVDFMREIFQDRYQDALNNILEYIGELCNQLAGRLKLKLESHGIKLQITTPSAQFGDLKSDPCDTRKLLLKARSQSGSCQIFLHLSKIGDEEFARKVDGVLLDGGVFF